MRYLFELSKEHKTLPTSEVFSCLKAEMINYNIIESNEDVLIIETIEKEDKIKKLADKLALTFFIDEFLFSCVSSAEKIKKKAIDYPIKKNGSVAIRYRNRSDNTIDSQSIVQPLAEIYSNKRKVILVKPDIEIRGIITKSTVYVCLKIKEVNRRQFEQRKVQYRPFFSPISIHPKLARSLVNIACVKKNEVLLDPFCGTGGLLLEAGLIGIKIIGSDIEKKMIEGSKITMDFYKINNYELFCSDIGDIKKKIGKVDAVVTDLPYGKATTTKGEDIKQLYDRAFKNISHVLKQQGKAVIGLSNKDMIYLGEKYLTLIEVHDFRAHRSLIRYFAVYQK